MWKCELYHFNFTQYLYFLISSEQLIIRTVDAIVRDGYKDAGYEYVIIDDCWLEKERGPDDRLVPDRKRFPNGMKYLADYVSHH